MKYCFTKKSHRENQDIIYEGVQVYICDGKIELVRYFEDLEDVQDVEDWETEDAITYRRHFIWEEGEKEINDDILRKIVELMLVDIDMPCGGEFMKNIKDDEVFFQKIRGILTQSTKYLAFVKSISEICDIVCNSHMQ